MVEEKYFNDFVSQFGLDGKEFTDSEKADIMNTHSFSRYMFNVTITDLRNSFSASLKPISNFVRERLM